MTILIDKILFLVPDAQCSVWNCTYSEYQGDGKPKQGQRLTRDKEIHKREDCVVWWPKMSNSTSLPSRQEIANIDPEQLDIWIKNRDKQNKISVYEADTSIKSQYEFAKVYMKETCSFEEFLTKLGLIS